MVPPTPKLQVRVDIIAAHRNVVVIAVERIPVQRKPAPTCTAPDEAATPSFLMVPHTRTESPKQTTVAVVSFDTTRSGGETSTLSNHNY